MDDHIYVVVPDAEEKVSLDHLEALVDQGRAVEGDDRTHVPRGVRECLLRGDVAQVVPASVAEGSAARGEDEATNLFAGAAAQALGEGGVLGVDRHDLVWSGSRGDQRPAGDKRLLVGERQSVSGV